MRRLVIVVTALLIGGWAFAETTNYDFSEVGSKHTSVFLRMHNSNTGGETADKLGCPGTSNPYYALYQFQLPDNMAGATVNSATFTVTEQYWTSDNLHNVWIRRLDTAMDWDPGDGTWNGRWSNDNGCGNYFATCTFDNGNVADAYDWNGNHYTWLGTSSRLTDHIMDKIDNGTIYRGATYLPSVFDVAPLVQNWADHMLDNATGWRNSGFLIWTDEVVGDNGMPSLNVPTVVIDWTAYVPPVYIPGDANGDNKVDGGDLAIWQQNYDPLGTGNNTFAMGDFNDDNKIDGGDLAIWQQNYDPIGPGGADGVGTNVPEPATLALSAVGAVLLGLRRRRRSRHL